MLQVAVWTLLLFSPSLQEAFSDSKHCPEQGTNDCHCTATDIECHSRNLSRIPTFRSTNWEFTLLDLEDNSIQNIPSRAFGFANVTIIDLRDNDISFVHPDAFTPLQGQLKSLDLRGNKLTFLPPAFAKLTSLTLLDVSYNPIPAKNFTDDVMRELGDLMNEFRFGDPQLDEWPATVHHFPALHIMKFYEGRMDRLPISAFAGFEWQLRKLWIQNTHLIAVPIALQDLHSIDELHFDNNIFVEDAGILIPAFAGLTNTLKTLTLENNTLTTFPLALSTLISLNNLSLSQNDLQFVSDQAVGNVGSNLTTLNLQSCNLDRIPGALSKLPGLINLDFSYNGITSIEKNDLQHMVNLRSLNVSHSPLKYVSRDTFYDLSSLEELILQNSSLYSVPEAIPNIPNLHVLDLTKEPYPDVECNCDLAWLFCHMQAYNMTLRIYGACYTIQMFIEEYVTQRVPVVCPKDC